MKIIFYVILLFLDMARAFAQTSGTAPAADASGDSYNFYFQKSPGPTTVNQGTSGGRSGQASATGTPAVQSTGVADLPATAGDSTLHIGASLGLHQDQARSLPYKAYGVNLGLNLTSSITLFAGMLLPAEELTTFPTTKNLTGQAAELEAAAAAKEPKRRDWYAGLSTVLVRERIKSGGFDLGFATGLMSAWVKEQRLGDGLPPHTSYTKTARVFIGPLVNVHFSRWVAFRLEAHLSGNQSNQYISSLAVKL